jgi:hypothetical protein
MMSNQLHGVVLMVLLFDVLVFYGSLESHHGGGGLMGLVVVYGGPTLDKYFCVVTIGDDDPCRRYKIPHL